MCKGKVQVNGNPPEKPTVRETLEHIRLAIEGGVEIVNGSPPGWHAFRPTDEEYAGFFDELLQDVKHPVAIAPNRIHSTCRKVSPQSDLPGESPDRITDAHNIRRRRSHVTCTKKLSLSMTRSGSYQKPLPLRKGQRVEVFIVAESDEATLETVRDDIARRGISESEIGDAIKWARSQP